MPRSDRPPRLAGQCSYSYSMSNNSRIDIISFKSAARRSAFRNRIGLSALIFGPSLLMGRDFGSGTSEKYGMAGQDI